MSHGPNIPDLFRRAAEYVDKILRGAKSGDLPVDQPTKFELVINLTTAKALGLTIPESFLLCADEVIEYISRVRGFAAPHMSACGTDRRTGVCGTDRCYQTGSRHQPACQAPLPRLKMTLNRHRQEDFAAMHCATVIL
jgi:ABC transporter substrate binding protein